MPTSNVDVAAVLCAALVKTTVDVATVAACTIGATCHARPADHAGIVRLVELALRLKGVANGARLGYDLFTAQFECLDRGQRPIRLNFELRPRFERVWYAIARKEDAGDGEDSTARRKWLDEEKGTTSIAHAHSLPQHIAQRVILLVEHNCRRIGNVCVLGDLHPLLVLAEDEEGKSIGCVGHDGDARYGPADHGTGEGEGDAATSGWREQGQRQCRCSHHSSGTQATQFPLARSSTVVVAFMPRSPKLCVRVIRQCEYNL